MQLCVTIVETLFDPFAEDDSDLEIELETKVCLSVVKSGKQKNISIRNALENRLHSLPGGSFTRSLLYPKFTAGRHLFVVQDATKLTQLCKEQDGVRIDNLIPFGFQHCFLTPATNNVTFSERCCNFSSANPIS
ncbi:hypothetical protein Ciccas_011146 [Cichlidogyrus casuarinus]|uniref:Uncharacterized protein n=1 Tax=Cichlidogyrus casuarinus TaxID=1844966 RepID=A0ABD2PS37_9PLAT